MPKNILFIDIETIPCVYRYHDLPEPLKELWNEKNKHRTDKSPEELYEKAGIYAEFARVFCIGIAYEKKENVFYTEIIHGDEKEILIRFSKFLNDFKTFHDPVLCAHNGKEFDFPFLCRRYLIHRLTLPVFLHDLQTRKPWEVKLLDTMEMWKFGDFKNYTSLDLLASLFELPSPKHHMKGSEVSRMVYEENKKEEVYKYCLEDVKTLVKVFYHLSGQHDKSQKITFAS